MSVHSNCSKIFLLNKWMNVAMSVKVILGNIFRKVQNILKTLEIIMSVYPALAPPGKSNFGCLQRVTTGRRKIPLWGWCQVSCLPPCLCVLHKLSPLEGLWASMTVPALCPRCAQPLDLVGAKTPHCMLPTWISYKQNNGFSLLLKKKKNSGTQSLECKG